MDEYQEKSHVEQDHNDDWGAGPGEGAHRWLVIAILALIVVSGIALAYGYRQQSTVRQLTAQASAANQSMNQLQSQVASLTSQLNGMTAAQTTNSAQPAVTAAEAPAPEVSTNATPAATASAAIAPAAAPAVSAKPATKKRSVAKRRAPTDQRYAKLQAQLTEQEKQLQDTREQMEKYRSDLEGNISSTRDELNGSIARTHEELVALEKRGERNYYEFDLSKSKQFQRVGPFSLSLRKADTKHKSYDLAMLVDDNQLTKKQVNLYEPISIHTDNESQSAIVVVNRIEKNLVHGYVSTPKYKPSDLSSGTAASATPVAANTSVSAGGNNGSAHQETQPQQ